MVKIKFNNETTFRDVEFYWEQDRIVLIGSNLVNRSGFKAYIDDEVIGDYTEYKTIYRQLDNGVVFSNDGSVEPTIQVKVNATWVDESEVYRPNELEVNYLLDGEENTLTLKASEDWEKYVSIKEHNLFELISCDNVLYYDKRIENNEITFTYHEPEPITIEDRIVALEEAVCELYER